MPMRPPPNETIDVETFQKICGSGAALDTFRVPKTFLGFTILAWRDWGIPPTLVVEHFVHADSLSGDRTKNWVTSSRQYQLTYLLLEQNTPLIIKKETWVNVQLFLVVHDNFKFFTMKSVPLSKEYLSKKSKGFYCISIFSPAVNSFISIIDTYFVRIWVQHPSQTQFPPYRFFKRNHFLIGIHSKDAESQTAYDALYSGYINSKGTTLTNPCLFNFGSIQVNI